MCGEERKRQPERQHTGGRITTTNNETKEEEGGKKSIAPSLFFFVIVSSLPPKKEEQKKMISRQTTHTHTHPSTTHQHHTHTLSLSPTGKQMQSYGLFPPPPPPPPPIAVGSLTSSCESIYGPPTHPLHTHNHQYHCKHLQPKVIPLFPKRYFPCEPPYASDPDTKKNEAKPRHPATNPVPPTNEQMHSISSSLPPLPVPSPSHYFPPPLSHYPHSFRADLILCLLLYWARPQDNSR